MPELRVDRAAEALQQFPVLFLPLSRLLARLVEVRTRPVETPPQQDNTDCGGEQHHELGADPGAEGAEQYPGWPVTLDMFGNYGRAPVELLPEIEVVGMEAPVVQLVDELTGEIVYTVRRRERRFALPVFAQGDYTVRVGEPGTRRWRSVEHLRSGEERERPIRVELGG